MTQIQAKNKEELINNISNYLLLEIQEYIPLTNTLNIFRYSKKYQEKLNINLSIYQKCFIKNKIKFDFDYISNDKLLAFFQKEFHNFTSEEDKTFFIKIIEENKKGKKYKENFTSIPPLISNNIEYEEKIIWKEDKYIIF